MSAFPVSETLQRAMLGAERGDLKSVWIIANYFLHGGDGITANRAKANQLLERLAEKGHAGACAVFLKHKYNQGDNTSTKRWIKYVQLALNKMNDSSFDDECYGYRQRDFRTELTRIFDRSQLYC